MIFQVIRTNIAKKPYSFVIFPGWGGGGGGGWNHCPHSGSAHEEPQNTYSHMATRRQFNVSNQLSLFLNERIAKQEIERTLLHNKTRTKHRTPTNNHLHQRRFRRIYLSTNPSPHDPQNLLLAQTNRPMKMPGRIFSIIPSCQSD